MNEIFTIVLPSGFAGMLAAKLFDYFMARNQKTRVGPQPFEVRQAVSLCEERHNKLGGQIDELFARTTRHEAEIAALNEMRERIDRKNVV